MENKELEKLILDTCKILNLNSSQFDTIYTAIKIAYNQGWSEGRETYGHKE